MDCSPNTGFTQSPSTPTSISTLLISSPVPAYGAVISLCMAAHHKLLISVIALSVAVGILLTLSLIVLFLSCLGLRHGREGPIPVERGPVDTTELILERPERSDRLGTGSNVTKNEEVAVLPSPLESGPPSSSKPRLEVRDASQGSHILPLSRVSSATSVHAFSEDDQFQCPCVQTDMVAQCSEHQPSPARSIAAFSIDDFDQGQDDEFHPEVRALLKEGKFTKEAVRNLKPIVPKADTVIPDYNPILDEIRPKKVDDYLLNYRIFFVIDDSGSMAGQRWDETRDALLEIADYALKYHSDAIDIRFFNSPYSRLGVRGMSRVIETFRSVSPSNLTPTGPVLKEVLDQQLNRLNTARIDGTYSSIRPLDIIVLTDGMPNSGAPPATVIEEAAKRFKAAGHHQNWVGIQFVQIGDDSAAEPTLLSLIDCANNNHMVDTVSYGFYKDEGGGKLTPQILERIILGALHPNLRSYWNQFRHKVNERTSQVIY